MTRSLHLSRRTFLSALTAGLGLARTRAWQPAGPAPPARVQTVLGPVSPETLGPTLIHEHLLVDFIGAAAVSRSRYDRDEVFARARPFLEQARAKGLHTLVECTPMWLGRDPELLRRLSQASGVAIVTNTGYYGAANDKGLPPHAFTESAEALSARWIAEAKDGIENTGIRPGFMKIGVDAGRLSEVDAKLVRAAALTHQATGLRIHSHTGDGVAAIAQLESARVAPRVRGRLRVGARAEREEPRRARRGGPPGGVGRIRRRERRVARRARRARAAHAGGGADRPRPRVARRRVVPTSASPTAASSGPSRRCSTSSCRCFAGQGCRGTRSGS